jgi:hypothetical protein
MPDLAIERWLGTVVLEAASSQRIALSFEKTIKLSP